MYNRQDVFKKHIQKKAEELNELCKQLGVVSFMSFAVKDCDNEQNTKTIFMAALQMEYALM